MTITFTRDDQPGIRRKGRKHFTYVHPNGRPVSAVVAQRINALAIPPAWTDVWISPDPNSHIQATGRDARGRKQYRYHDDFRRKRDKAKFSRLVEFGDALGGIRAQVDRDLRNPALSRDRVVAAVIRLMDQTYVRVGNEHYARENKSFGLTTLRCRHAHLDGQSLHLRFNGKGGKLVEVTCCDASLARVVRRCQDLPGQQLFQYVNGDGAPHGVASGDINDYLRAIADIDATAKTFRTWGASLLAAEAFASLETPPSERALRSVIKETLEPVAATLGNTVAVCRSSYVHPTVLTSFEKGTLQDRWAQGPSRARGGLSANERRLLAVLQPPV